MRLVKIVDNRKTEVLEKKIQKHDRVFHSLDYPLKKEFSRLDNTNQRNTKYDYR